jgi:hypothetical protein
MRVMNSMMVRGVMRLARAVIAWRAWVRHTTQRGTCIVQLACALAWQAQQRLVGAGIVWVYLHVNGERTKVSSALCGPVRASAWMRAPRRGVHH